MMTKMSKKWLSSRVLAAVLVMSLLFTSVFLQINVGADVSAADEGGKYYYVPKLTPTNFFKYGATATAAVGGGVSLGFSNVNHRGTLVGKAVRLDGLTLGFKNFQFSASNGGSDGALGIFLREEQKLIDMSYEDYAVNPIANANGVFRLVLSPTNNCLYGSKTGGSSVPIISNAALSAANLNGKSFEISMTKDPVGANYLVTVDIAGGATVSGSVAASMVESSNVNSRGFVTPQFGVTGYTAEGDAWAGGINCTFDYVKAGPAFGNADLIPAWVPDSEVAVDSNGEPEWVKSLMIAEVNLQLATPEGTLAAAYKVLDHYQELGVNGLWLLPIHDNGVTEQASWEGIPETMYAYGGLGFDTIHPKLTGEANYADGWEVFEDFLDEAHSRGIRIFLDITSWGFSGPTQVQADHPTWFTSNSYIKNHAFNWKNAQFKEWYIQQLVDLAMRVPIDGYRYDVEPQLAGIGVHREIRTRLETNGRKLFYMSELPNERQGVYTVGQGRGGEVNYNMNWIGETQAYPFLDGWNIVDSIKNGQHIGTAAELKSGKGAVHRYYVNDFSDHDRGYYNIRGNRAAIGYQGIFAPFIPLWYMGEEYNNSRFDMPQGMSLFYSGLHWNDMDIPENRAFYEDLKAMIRIRRQYPEIFENFPEPLKSTNICKVTVSGLEDLQAYARYAGDTAMLVVPNLNSSNQASAMTVTVPFINAGIDGYTYYAVTNAETGELIAEGTEAQVSQLNVNVPHKDQLVLKVQGFESAPDEITDFYYAPTVTATNFYRYGATAVPAVGGGVSFGLTEINNRGTLNNEAIRLDGMTLGFEDFQFSAANGASDGALGIFLRGEQPTGGGIYEDPAVNPIANANGVFRLVLSPTWEQLYASNTGGSSVSIISNSALSAVNLSGKSFEIRMVKDSDGLNYTVTIDISGGAELSGKIATAMVETASTNATGYVTPQFGITGVNGEGDGWTAGGINCTFDYVKAGPIFKPNRSDGVTVPSSSNNSPDHWGGACYTISNLSDGRGAFYNFFNSYNPDIRTAVNSKAYALDGLTFEFSSFTQMAGGTHLGITLSADPNAAASAAGQLQFIIDDNGSLQYRVKDVTGWANAISSTLLTPGKRAGQALKLQFVKKPDISGDYTVNLWVGNTKLTGTLPAAAAGVVPSGAYAILSMLDGGVGSVNYHGIYNALASVSFNANGGTGTMAAIKAEKGQIYTLPVCGFSRTDYVFDGWKIANTGDLLSPGTTMTVSDDFELYAQWSLVTPEQAVISIEQMLLKNISKDLAYDQNNDGVINILDLLEAKQSCLE